MVTVLVIVAPGQGAQTPGFLAPWLEDPVFAARFDWLATVAGIDLAHYGTEADAETIRDTKVAQPLLVATGLVAALDHFPHPADAFSRSRQDEGCIEYAWSADLEQRGLFHFFEIWADQRCLDAHLAADYEAAFMRDHASRTIGASAHGYALTSRTRMA